MTATIAAVAIMAAANFVRAPKKGGGKRFEMLAGIWTLVLYLSLGLIPLSWRIFHGR
jgi:4-hydroxybenzoate polyprenyltransferase